VELNRFLPRVSCLLGPSSDCCSIGRLSQCTVHVVYIRYSTINIINKYTICMSELSIGWVDPWVGLGRDFSVFGGLGWVYVHYSKSTKI